MSDDNSQSGSPTNVDWKNVVPNWDGLGAPMQEWIRQHLGSLIAVARQVVQGQDGGSQSAAASPENHNFGLAVTGVSYGLVGGNDYKAVMGYASETFQKEKTELFQTGRQTKNFGYDNAAISGTTTLSVGGDEYKQVKGASRSSVKSSADSVEEDETTLVGGNSTKLVAGYETIEIGSSLTDNNEIASNTEIFGSENKLLWGNGWERIVGRRYAAVGPGVSVPVAESKLVAGSTVPPVTVTTSDPTNKNIVNGVKLGWTAVSGMNPASLASTVTNTILGTTPKTPDYVSVELIGGDKQESVYGSENILITGSQSETILQGTNNMALGVISEMKLGMVSDTVLGLSMDALIGMSMPFELMTIGQTVVSIESKIYGMESTTFEMALSALHIRSAGAAEAADAADAAEDADDAEEAGRMADVGLDGEKAPEFDEEGNVIEEADDAGEAGREADVGLDGEKPPELDEAGGGEDGGGDEERVADVGLDGEEPPEIEGEEERVADVGLDGEEPPDFEKEGEPHEGDAEEHEGEEHEGEEHEGEEHEDEEHEGKENEIKLNKTLSFILKGFNVPELLGMSSTAKNVFTAMTVAAKVAFAGASAGLRAKSGSSGSGLIKGDQGNDGNEDADKESANKQIEEGEE